MAGLLGDLHCLMSHYGSSSKPARQQIVRRFRDHFHSMSPSGRAAIAEAGAKGHVQFYAGGGQGADLPAAQAQCGWAWDRKSASRDGPATVYVELA
jgi:hypothetical protein